MPAFLKQLDRRLTQRPDLAGLGLLAAAFLLALLWHATLAQGLSRLLFAASAVFVLAGTVSPEQPAALRRRCLIVLLMSLAAGVGFLFVDVR